MLPHLKAKEIFKSGKFTDEQALEYIQDKIDKTKTKYYQGWWLTVKSQYEILIIKRNNENKS